jgi:hypothetical protein
VSRKPARSAYSSGITKMYDDILKALEWLFGNKYYRENSEHGPVVAI